MYKLTKSFLSALTVYLYVILISLFMINGERIFQAPPSIMTYAVFLLLMIISVGLCGGLLLGVPVVKIIKGDTKAGLVLFFANLAWLALFAAVTVIFVLIFK